MTVENSNNVDGESNNNEFEAWFMNRGDPKAAIVYPQCHFWFSVKNSSKWCGFIKFESITNGVISEPVLTDTEEGLVNEEVSFHKSVFAVPFFVGYHEDQYIRVTVYDGDQMRLHQGYCMASLEIPLSEVTRATSEFSLCRGDKELGKLYVHTTLDRVTKVTKLFSDDIITSLNFCDTAPDEVKLRKEYDYFNANMNFYVFKFNCPNLIEYDKKILKSLSGYYFYLKMNKGVKDSSGDIIVSESGELWRSRKFESPPFKLKVGGITQSHEDLTGFVDARAKPDAFVVLVMRLFFVSKDGEEICVAQCDVPMPSIIDLEDNEKVSFSPPLTPIYRIKEEDEKSSAFETRSEINDEGLDSVLEGKDNAVDTVDDVKTPKSSYSLRSFVSRTLSMRSSASTADSNSKDMLRESIQKLCKKFGDFNIKVKKQVNVQKVGAGNELYEGRVSAIVEHVRARWYLRLLDVFQQAVVIRRLECVRYMHFLKRINAGWSFRGKMVADMYHPCLQNILGQVYQQTGKNSKLLTTSTKSCRVLDASCLFFSAIQPFLRDREMTAIAGGWITLPSPRFSRFASDHENAVEMKGHGKKGNPQYEPIDEYFVRNIGFPIAQEFLSCVGVPAPMNEFFPIQFIKSLTNWLITPQTDPEESHDEVEAIVGMETTQPINGIFATPNSCDPHHLLRNWASKVSNDPLYAKKIKYKDLGQLIQGFMEASGIYFPAQQMIEAAQSKRNKSDVPQSINQINLFRKNETRRIACYTGTDYDIEVNPAQLSILSDLSKTPMSGKKERSFDLDTLHSLLNQKVSNKELNVVTWVLGRSPPTSEQKKFRALMSEHLTRDTNPSALLIILAAEQRYDVTNTDKDMLSKIADPFADFLNWYNDSLQPTEQNQDDDSESRNIHVAFDIASNLGILPIRAVDTKAAVLHFVTWAEVMAKAYQLDDIERQRMNTRRDQEDQQNHGKIEDEDTEVSFSSTDSQLPSVMSIKEVLMSIFSVEIAEKILGQRVEDWFPGESEDMVIEEISQGYGESIISHRDMEAMGVSRGELERRSATDDHRSSVGKMDTQVLAQMKKYIGVTDGRSDDGHSITSHAKIDRDNSPHFAVGQRDLIKEIKSFHELNKIKIRFDLEMQILMKRKIGDQLAIFLLAFDFSNAEYEEYIKKLLPIF